MILSEELLARGFDNHTDEGYELDMYFSPSGKVCINLEEPEKGYHVSIFKDVIDNQGVWAAEPCFETTKPSTLTIEEFMGFVEFVEPCQEDKD